MSTEHQCVLSKSHLYRGRLVIQKSALTLFPSVRKTTKIQVILERVGEISVNYNGKWHLLYGLTEWFRKTGASPGDRVSFERVSGGKIRLKLVPK